LGRLLGIALVVLAVPIGGMAQQRAAAAAEAGESRVALVIGNASYKDAPLANPVHDARAVAKALNGLGFKVSLRVNLTQTQLRRAIREFGDELHATQGVGLFYFAGHGVQISNRNFLIPVGSDIQREYEVEEQAVDAGTVMSMMQSARARVNIVILDACRNNPFIRDFRSTVNGLAPMQAPAGSLIAFSTAPGQTAIDGSGQLGLYTEHLVENIALPGLKIEDVFKNVRIGVQRASGGKQVPWENTSLTGDFYFKGPVAVAATAAAVAPPAVAVMSQHEIERVVLAAISKREQELAAAKTARAERDAAREAIEGLQKELAELRAAREADKAHAARPAVERAEAPSQVALAAPGLPQARPSVSVGGRVERPQARAGNQWTYQVTERYTGEKRVAVIKVATVTGNRIYTSSTHSTLAMAGVPAAPSVVDVWDGDWNLLRQGEVEYTPFYPSFQFPLEAGRKWSGSVTFTTPIGDTVRHEVNVQVVGWERITVPAGNFDAVKITLRGQLQVTAAVGTGDGTISDVVWYAPAVGQLIKKEIEQHAYTAPASYMRPVMSRYSRYERWELLEFKLN
jgi:uncharacterized caspase-like protein